MILFWILLTNQLLFNNFWYHLCNYMNIPRRNWIHMNRSKCRCTNHCNYDYNRHYIHRIRQFHHFCNYLSHKKSILKNLTL